MSEENFRLPMPVISILSFALTLYAIGLTLYLLARVLFGDRFRLLGLLNNFTPWYFLPLVICLPLALLLQERWLPALMLGLTGAAVAWFGPYYLPHRAKQSTDDPALRILTFNIWGDNPCKPELATLFREINADVVFLQELPQSFIRNELPRLLGLYPYQFVPTIEGDWWNNATLSRYPMVECEGLLTWDIGVPALDRTVIDVDGRRISAYNAHMRVPFKLSGAGSFLDAVGRALRYDESERRRLIGKMLDYLKAERNPYIVAGDFNMSCYSESYHDIANAMVDSFREAGRGFGLTWPHKSADTHFSVSLPMLRIDYIWHSPDLTAVEATRKPPFGSDHLPVYATIKLNRT